MNRDIPFIASRFSAMVKVVLREIDRSGSCHSLSCYLPISLSPYLAVSPVSPVSGSDPTCPDMSTYFPSLRFVS